MKRLLFVISAALLCLGNTQCQNNPVTVHPGSGPAQQSLDASVAQQIESLKANIKTLEDRDVLQQKTAAEAAGAVHGIQVAAPHIKDPKDKDAGDAIMSEAKIAAKALELRKDAPAEVVATYAKKALEAENRVTLWLTGQRDQAMLATAAALQEVDAQRALVAAKDAEIVAAQQEIAKRDAEITKQRAAAEQERLDNAKNLQDAFDAKDAAINKLKDEQAAKERSLWINALRGTGILFIVIGVVFIAITKGEAIIQGGILVVSGAGVIGIGMAFDIVAKQPWFPYMAALVFLAVLTAIGWFVYHLVKTHTFAQKATAVFDDIKTEAEISGNKLWEEVSAHTDFRNLTDTIKKKAVKLGFSEKTPKTSSSP